MIYEEPDYVKKVKTDVFNLSGLEFSENLNKQFTSLVLNGKSKNN